MAIGYSSRSEKIWFRETFFVIQTPSLQIVGPRLLVKVHIIGRQQKKGKSCKGI